MGRELKRKQEKKDKKNNIKRVEEYNTDIKLSTFIKLVLSIVLILFVLYYVTALFITEELVINFGNDKSTSVEPFNLNIPFEIVLDDRFETSKATIDIDDFYYEIVNNNVLSVSIDVLVDHLQEKPLIEMEELVDVTPVRTVLDLEEEEMENSVEERCIEEEDTLPKRNVENIEEKINSIFSNGTFNDEVYVTYNVFIIRDGDTLDSIMEKYNVTQDELEKYNDLSNLKLGDKLIIPNCYEGN